MPEVCVGLLLYSVANYLLSSFDFTTTNLNDVNLELMKQDDIPDVVSKLFIYITW